MRNSLYRNQEWQDPGNRSVPRPGRTWKEPTKQERLEIIQDEIKRITSGESDPKKQCPLSTKKEILTALENREAVLMAEIERNTSDEKKSA